MVRNRRVAIIGNPNCGKTTLFNRLTGSHQKIGNWAGVTVDKKVGMLTVGDMELEVVDLPGIYSLNVAAGDSAVDEAIASKYIIDGEADIFINIIDAANMQRNLYLTLQLLEMGVPVIIALNMCDIAKKRNIIIDTAELAKALNCPVVELVSSKGRGLTSLKAAMIDYEQTNLQQNFNYTDSIESAIRDIQNLLIGQQRWQAIRLLEKDQIAEGITNNVDKIKNTINKLEGISKEDSDILIADQRYQTIQQIYQNVVKSSQLKKTLTMHIDKLFMHRILGIPIFLGIMYLMFEFSMNIGTLLQPLFDISSTVIFIDGVTHLGHLLGLPMWLIALLAQGVGLGINTVVNFVPQIGLMFLFLSFLEDSGYMARAAFVMDRFMQAVGLPGKAFIPLIVGFGCNVPSIMATRTLDSRRDRILTTMMSPFMSCGARLAIFVVFASAFYPQHGGLVVFILYITGIVIAMLTGFIMKISLLRGEDTPFIMELPAYHLPHGRTISIMTWQRLKRFVFRAGKVIVPVCVLVGTLNAIDFQGHINPKGSQHSILSEAGRAITPVLAPMGVKQDNWPATVGLITGTLAKEVVVGTLNTLYTQDQFNSQTQKYNFWGGMKNAVVATVSGFEGIFTGKMLNPFTANEADHNMTRSAMGNMFHRFSTGYAAFAYLLFVLLYIPCVSTIGVIGREIGKGWAYMSTFWSFSIAYSVAVIFYQTVTFELHPVYSGLWIIGLILFQVGTVKTFQYYADRSVIKVKGQSHAHSK